MATAVKLSENIVSEAKIVSKVFNRSVAGQIEYWAKIGRLAEENPDLTFDFIKTLLFAQQEAQSGKLEPYDADPTDVIVKRRRKQMEILQTPTFGKQKKKLHKNQINDLNNAIKQIVINPDIGDIKKGDLAGVQVYKFTMINQLTLLAYTWDEYEQQLVLIALGSHENFYRDLKKTNSQRASILKINRI